MKTLNYCFLMICAVISCNAAMLMLETEAFADKGGWVVDQQFMDQMGSPFLLAHGLGKPVRDAMQSVHLEKGAVKIALRDLTGFDGRCDAIILTNTKNFPGEEFKSICKHIAIHPYPIPYRCLYSKNVDNLFMAGRNISVTHVALGTIRVMRTTGMMGEVVGMASSICVKNGCNSRGVYEKHLAELKGLMKNGVGIGGEHPPQTYNMGHCTKREKPVEL